MSNIRCFGHALPLCSSRSVSICKLQLSCLQVSFQFLFTGPAFGTYATFVFLRTGHLAAAIAVHSFCNWMGFPPIADVLSHPRSRKLIAFYMLGICGFAALVRPVTNPALYTNIRYDQTVKAIVAQRGMH